MGEAGGGTPPHLPPRSYHPHRPNLTLSLTRAPKPHHGPKPKPNPDPNPDPNREQVLGRRKAKLMRVVLGGYPTGGYPMGAAAKDAEALSQRPQGSQVR